MARKEKVTESTSTLEAQSEQPQSSQPEFGTGAPTQDDSMQLVEDPGPVKHIVFEGLPEEQRFVREEEPQEDESQYEVAVPQGRSERTESRGESLYTIRDEVDRLHAPDPNFAGAPARANLQPWRSSTVYRTEQGGEVRSHEGPTGKSFTLSDARGERRFSASEVDRVIENIDLADRRTRHETVESSSSETVQEEAPAKRRRGFFGLGRKKEKAAEPPAAEYQPQCGAITEEGAQCRNSAREGSKYCSSHFGFHPKTTQGIHQSRDTEPRFESSRDTKPGVGWDPEQAHRGSQCSAVTKGGKQCQNPTVAGTSYCGSHQGYSEPTAREIVQSVDTKPRWSKAKDTKPSTRKPSAKAAAKSPKSSGKGGKARGKR